MSIDSVQVPALLRDLARVPDPRDPRGVIHPLVSLLAVAVAAVLAGARSVTAIGEWVADVPATVLAALGVVRDPFTGFHRVPDATTIGRVLADLDGDAFDTAVSQWLVGLHTPPADQPPHRRAYATDGKTLRGSGPAGSQVHLLAAVDHHTGAVVAQTAVDGKTNEITRFVPLLADLDLAGAVVTADALHTQREHARWLVEQRNAGYVFVVKKNQPTLYHQVKHLPWGKVPIDDEVHTRGHGRDDIRRLQVVTVARSIGLDFPYAVQAVRVRRRRMNLTTGRWSTVTVYAVTNFTADQATPAELADWLRGHWTIEVLHHVRDVTFAEDASQLRTGNAPRAMATLRNAAVSVLRLAGTTTIARALRHNARDPHRPLRLLGLLT
ncbi:ISAs1 family transposase [Planosporangium sp. 12N6]|uniref:ISAs1 family transposase n=1 Tax=Planosporangium spinosum TaxID=3402278 RepID=UPI003CEFE884